MPRPFDPRLIIALPLAFLVGMLAGWHGHAALAARICHNQGRVWLADANACVRIVVRPGG